MNLRKVSRDYVTTDLKAELEERLKADGLSDIRIKADTDHTPDCRSDIGLQSYVPLVPPVPR